MGTQAEAAGVALSSSEPLLTSTLCKCDISSEKVSNCIFPDAWWVKIQHLFGYVSARADAFTCFVH